MLRLLLSSLLIPVIRRVLPRIIRAGMDGVNQHREQEAERQKGTAHYERDKQVVSGKVTKIVDGDSLYIQGHKPQIRLWGVNAPEKHQPGYNQATQALRQLASEQTLRIEIVAPDKYGRSLGRCFFPSGAELNYELIKTGKVKEYFRYTKGYYANLR